jgi:hypothetical protein
MATTSSGEAAAPSGTLSLEQVHEAYYQATGKTSDIVRQLSFAGIGMIWILSGGSLTPTRQLDIDNDLLLAGLGLVVALALDLAQYAYRSAAWGIYGRRMENQDAVFASPSRRINWAANALFG